MEVNEQDIKIGDIFKADLQNGTARYFQYIADDLSQLNSRVIRIFNTIYQVDDTPSINQIIDDDIYYYLHVFIIFGVLDDFWVKIGHSNTCGKINNIRFFTTVDDKWMIWTINGHMFRIGFLPIRYRKACLGVLFQPERAIKIMRDGPFSVHPSLWSIKK